MADTFEVTIKVPAENSTAAAQKAKVLQNFVKKLSDADFQKLSEKIKSDPSFFNKITPYLSML